MDVSGIINSKPKHAQVADIIRSMILSGDLAKGSRLQTDDELAQKYKINRHTVAAGLNSLVEEGMLERAPRRGTIVIKETEKGKSVTNAVAMVMLSKGDVFSDISLKISKGLGNRKLFPVLINENVITDEHCVKNYMDSMVDEFHRPYGFIIDGIYEFPFSYLRSNLGRFENIVFINQYHHPEKIESARYALVDFVTAGKLAAQHLISRGHRNLTCLAIPEKPNTAHWSSMQINIMTGFAEECQSAGIKFSDEVFWKLIKGAPFDSTVGALFKEKDRPTAIFAYSDSFIRSNVIPLLESKGLKPMKDVELIGCYNTHHAEECGFSSISICEEKIAEAAVKLLTNETEEREIMIKPELIVRGQ